MRVNMRQVRKDLKPFDMARLNEFRKLMSDMYWGEGPNKSFWDELERVLKCNPKSYEWSRMVNDEVVLGEVWCQHIGEFWHMNTVHIFSYLYVESQGLAIAEHGQEHGHEEPFHNGKQVIKASEWYIFPDGKMELCKKDCTHKLVNEYGEPIYVISLKICSNAIIKNTYPALLDR